MPAHDENGADHYKLGNGLQTINLIDIFVRQCQTNQEAVRLANVIKYLSRYRSKGGAADLRKAQDYLSWLIEEVEEKT